VNEDRYNTIQHRFVDRGSSWTMIDRSCIASGHVGAFRLVSFVVQLIKQQARYLDPHPTIQCSSLKPHGGPSLPVSTMFSYATSRLSNIVSFVFTSGLCLLLSRALPRRQPTWHAEILGTPAPTAHRLEIVLWLSRGENALESIRARPARPTRAGTSGGRSIVSNGSSTLTRVYIAMRGWSNSWRRSCWGER